MRVYGDRIRGLREERGYSLVDLAQQAGVSISYLSEIERGAKKPSLKTIDKIAGALNINKTQLVDLDGTNECLGLGDRVRLLREDCGLSLTALAESTGISISYLSEVERGNVYPALHTLRALAQQLGVAVSTLVGKGGALGGKVKQVREEQGLTQAELARRAGVSPGLIGQIEHGKVQPSLQTVERIAEALGNSPCYFIADEAGVDEMLRLMQPEVRELLQQANVQAVLRQVCSCNADELRFILDFIKLYKRVGVGLSQ